MKRLSAALSGVGRTGHPSLLAHCVLAAALHYAMPVHVLWAIRLTEGGALGMVQHNPNGSYDYGPFQINSIWLPTLRRYGIGRRALADSPCANAFAAAYILRLNWVESGGKGLWQAVARYHSDDPALGTPYVWQVYHTWLRIGGGRGQ